MLITLVFASCTSRFEKDFNNKLEEGIERYKVTKQPVIFNLSDITSFKWDKMLLICGNESVPVESEYIEKLIGQKTDDLGLNEARFYFFYKSKLVKEIEISHGYHDQAFSIETCSDTIGFLKVSECRFKLIPNTLAAKTGTIFLYTTCKEIPEILLKSIKE